MQALTKPTSSKAVYPLNLSVNGRGYTVEASANKTLLEVLREDLGLTGVRRGCDTSHCGCCTVLLDGLAVHSCSILAPRASGREVTTVEGLAQGGALHPLQQAFVQNGAIQCGYCTPGMILAAKALLDEVPNPTEAEIRGRLDGNICRCTGYQKIVSAVRAAATGSSEASREG